ncbi:MAG: triose-phosphate isomerase [Nanoarchaeota archaeon]|nr:triose-phosphate isomerase [Nanoarchaeota archaeon]
MKPIVIINFKTYKQGKAAIELAKQIEKVDKSIILGAQASDIYEIARATKGRLRVYSQHVDYQKKGKATGYILPEAIKKDGAVGSFLNHSEHKLKFNVLKKTMKRCRQLGLKTIVFASSLSEAIKIEKLKPDYLIYEPPELVGGKTSVSKAKPELIKRIAEKLNMKFLVGAGIHNKDDVNMAMKLGASGFAVSSAVCEAREPGKKLREMIR